MKYKSNVNSYRTRTDSEKTHTLRSTRYIHIQRILYTKYKPVKNIWLVQTENQIALTGNLVVFSFVLSVVNVINIRQSFLNKFLVHQSANRKGKFFCFKF